MFRIVVLAIAILLIGAALALSESSEGIRIVSARDLLRRREGHPLHQLLNSADRFTASASSWRMRSKAYSAALWAVELAMEFAPSPALMAPQGA